MILSADLRTVLIHFDSGADWSGHPGSRSGHESSISEGTLARMRWYLEWSSEGGRTIHVLVPGDLESPDQELLQPASQGRLIRYRDEGDLAIPLPRRRGFTFIINGNQFPIVHWRRAVASAQRHNTDVVVFGPAGALTGTDYPESVLVDSEGQVIRFKRHYVDSPGFADRWSGDAAFLVVRSEHAQAVAAHIVVRGWGLDSIGALVRRFGVRWLSDSRVLSDDRLGRNELVALSRHRAINWKTPIEPVDAALEQPRGKTNHGETQEDLIAGSVHECSVEDAAHSDGSWAMIDDSGGEYTLATDDLPDISDSRSYLFAKRALDIAVSATALIVLFPFLIFVSLLIKLTSRGPVVYAHTRQGLRGREFPCLKFRSMRTGAHAIQAQLRALNEVDGPQFKITSDPRVTRLGNWLRKTNIDELPQLLNVLLGQMSLVGPRPSPDQENQYCPAWRRARLSTKPGITGLWQVLRKRDECASDFQEWIYYDVEYARHRCFWLDLQILFYTPLAMYATRHVAPFAARLGLADICTHSDKKMYQPA
jgi:lipopolysaccharide/colanic/teichoic acid biosynthesis glycosyltransferase